MNLATSLAATASTRRILLDFDLMFGSVDACLDIIPDNTLYNVVQNFDRLDLTLLKRSMTRHACGPLRLPHPVALEDAAKIDPETLRRLLGLLKAAFPCLVIDTSKGLQSSDFVAFEMADVILMVIVLDLTCLRNTARLLNLFKQFDRMVDRVKLVVNRAGSVESEISLKKAEETLRCRSRGRCQSRSTRFRTRGSAVFRWARLLGESCCISPFSRSPCAAGRLRPASPWSREEGCSRPSFRSKGAPRSRFRC